MMCRIKAFVNGVEDLHLENAILPLDVAKIICGLAFANMVASIREEELDEVIVKETDTSCYARFVETGIEVEFRIEEIGA